MASSAKKLMSPRAGDVQARFQTEVNSHCNVGVIHQVDVEIRSIEGDMVICIKLDDKVVYQMAAAKYMADNGGVLPFSGENSTTKTE